MLWFTVFLLFGFASADDLSNDNGVPTLRGAEDGDLFEGDIVVEENGGGAVRNAVKDPNRKWAKDDKGHAIVPYVLDIQPRDENDTAFNAAIHAFKTATRMYAEHTCIRFVPRKDQANYLKIQRSANGCWSGVGYCNKPNQTLNLGRGCEARGIAAHEMMHALGFLHEQSRPDRDEWITIVWDNIQPGKEHNFDKANPNDYTTQDLPYDYESIMHYGDWFFQKQPKMKTMVPKQQGHIIGHRNTFSPLDIKKLNKLYECAPSAIADDLNAPEGEDQGCPAGWEKQGHKCFLDLYQAYPAEEGKKLCEKTGGTLPSVSSSDDQNNLAEYLKKYGLSNVRLGIYRKEEGKDEWLLPNGSPATYFNWRPNEPGKKEMCTLTVRNDDYKWHDWDCSAEFRIICERNAA